MKINTRDLSGGMKFLMAIVSIIMIIVGFILFFDSVAFLWLFFSAVVLRGIAMVISYFGSKGNRNGWDLIIAIMHILFAFWIISGNIESRAVTLIAIELFVALWLVLSGLGNAFGCFKARKEGHTSWLWMLIGGLLSVAAGILLFIFPLLGVLITIPLISIFAGLSLVISGITGLAGALTRKVPIKD